MSNRGTVEMVMPGGPSGKDLLVLYKCPYCCTGDKQVKWEIVETQIRDMFVNAACANQDIRIQCLNCDRTIILDVDSGLVNMMQAFRRTL